MFRSTRFLNRSVDETADSPGIDYFGPTMSYERFESAHGTFIMASLEDHWTQEASPCKQTT